MAAVRVLQVVSELNQGGIENFLMNIYRNIDREKVQFDFIVHHMRRGCFEDEIEKMGGKVYHFSLLDDKNIMKYIKNLKCFFRKHKDYSILHGHLASIGFLYLSIAKKEGIKCRIAHSHGTATPKSIKGRIKSILFKGFKKNANILFACSDEAGKFLFGDSNYTVVPNAIDFNRFSYDEKKRLTIRKQNNIKNEMVVGHVGRFTIEKNHEFIIEILKNMSNKEPNIKFLLIGDGSQKKRIMQKALEEGVDDKIIFAGNRLNVEDYYSAMDIFILPSLFEGFPVACVEAQANGLKSFFSSNISKEVKITNLASFIDGFDAEIWSKKILSIDRNYDRKRGSINKKYDICELAKNMEEYYIRNDKGRL
ncbi:glycosyltransferase family 1 protein [Candidatus Saccharibacteria bacterium]|nr:glycosyltransferase family 1 protein [Candidatus Saccharibacteria bacterium]